MIGLADVCRRSSQANISDGRQRLVAVTRPHAATSNPPSTSVSGDRAGAEQRADDCQPDGADLERIAPAARVWRQHRAAKDMAHPMGPQVIERMPRAEARDDTDPT